jgi:hypothetical protein
MPHQRRPARNGGTASDVRLQALDELKAARMQATEELKKRFADDLEESRQEAREKQESALSQARSNPNPSRSEAASIWIERRTKARDQGSADAKKLKQLAKASRKLGIIKRFKGGEDSLNAPSMYAESELAKVRPLPALALHAEDTSAETKKALKQQKARQKAAQKVADEKEEHLSKIEAWSAAQVVAWINEQASKYSGWQPIAGKYSPIFRQEGVDGSVLLELGDADLADLGVREEGSRIAILAGIRALKVVPKTKRKKPTICAD